MSFRSVVLLGVVSCATVPATGEAPGPKPVLLPEETHLSELTQLSFGGENAEAYWSFDGRSLSLQARKDSEGCDRIYTLALDNPVPKLLSSGKGATTCAHYLPGGDEVIYASTHLGGEACPAKPDMSLGYVWALYDSYDIFKVKTDGTGLTRLTDTKGYDAEGTVCGKDGSIIFTSTRDGDIELYRMDKDGQNVKRLTSTPGYDGGAFFNQDCSKIVWRASRPKNEQELAEFRELLGRGLVRPSKLDLYVANADGSDAHQVTYLNAASFAPFWFPNRERILFSSNVGDPKGRDFDIWAINADGTDLERITYAKGFDGFPMFSPDGTRLAFSSNRVTAEGQHDTNLFVAKWVEGPAKAKADAERTGAERILQDVTWLADAAREGRGLGSKGLRAAGDYLADRFKALGLEPLGANGTYQAPFEVTTQVTRGASTALLLGGKEVAAADFSPLGFSAQGSVKGPLVLANYGLDDAALGLNDYEKLEVRGKIVVVRRFAPESEKLSTSEQQRRAGDLRRKVFNAKSRGAKAVIVVDWPLVAAKAPMPGEAPLVTLRRESADDAGLPVLIVTRAAMAPVWPKLEAKQRVEASFTVALELERATAFNVVGAIRATHGSGEGPLIIGAHYDHLGFGGPNSLAPDQHVVHPGADDNASGTSTMLEIARLLMSRRDELARDVVMVAFSGEEEGVLGSNALVQSKPEWLSKSVAMLNLDMVGRLRGNTLSVLGNDTAPQWSAMIQKACGSSRVVCNASGDGYGPSDHMTFYTAGYPVLFFFTGSHSEYHKPTDTAATINAGGAGQIAKIVADIAVEATATPLTFQRVASPPVAGDARSFNASLGTVPNYGGPPPGVKGVLLDDVRPGGGAEKGGLKRGDIITKLGKFDVGSVEDLMFVLMQAKPGETVKAGVLREGKPLVLEVTFQEGRRH